MKIKFLLGCLILALSTPLISCGPAVLPSAGFAGTWTTNLGMVNIIQKDNEVTLNIDGYGDQWNETFSGSLNENGEAVFETEILGSLTLGLDGENSFRSTSSDVSFCGVRGADAELPAGCGFSGKWIVPSKHVFLPGSYMVLTQTGNKVTGDLYNGNNQVYDSFSGIVDWGKGWRANGATTERGEVSLWINSSETGFQFMSEKGNIQELCAIREGFDSAYLGSFSCKP